MNVKIKIFLFTVFAILISACFIISIILLTSIGSNKNTQNIESNSSNIIYKNDSISNEFATLLLQRINKSVDPCDDFYEYACGNWIINNPSPNYTSSWTVYDVVSQNVGKLVEDSINNCNINDASEGLIKAKQFYNTCINVTLTEENKGIVLGKLLHTGRPENDKFNKFLYNNGKWPLIDSSWNLSNINISIESQIGYLKKEFGIDTFIYTYAMGYDIQSNLTILLMTGEMLPLGLGIFSQENYFNDKIMDAYSVLQEKVAYLLARDSNLTLIDGKINKNDLKMMLQVEIDLAKVIQNVYMKPNSNTTDDLYSLITLQQVLPGFAWKDYLSSLLPKTIYDKILDGKKLINLDSLTYILEVKKLLLKYQFKDLQNYMIWRLIKYSLPYMSTEYTQLLADFSAILYGQPNQVTPVNETCLGYVRGNYEMPNLGYAITEGFVKKNFHTNTKDDATILIKDVKESLEYIMLQSEWMDEVTKSNALKKAIFMKTFTAYPDWVMNKTLQNIYYKDLLAPQGVSFVSLNLMLRSWAVVKNFELIDTKTNFLDFHGPPVATDAWYTATTNSFSIPIDAANYGAVGAVAGHEMSHGFDATGHQFDEYGNINDWWTNKSEEMFNEKLICMEKQFSKYCYPNIGCINGKNTVNENVADLAGLKAALKAYEIKKITHHSGKEERLKLIPEYTMDQLFYLNFASFWCGKESKESLKMTLDEDSHSPGKYRVIGTLQNIPEFSRAFNCQIGSKMNPIDKCSIW
uniref:Neprilysin n=1 Tax=Strongyloides stercoralis TaxID=6248 RepID=A0A0K0EMK7_STRER